MPSGKDKRIRIAVLGIYHETNTFVEATTMLSDFKKSRWMKGDVIVKEYENAYHELGGGIEVFKNNHVDILPVFYTETTPGGIITEEAYQELVEEMMNELEKVLPIDACFVVPHGAAVAINHPDMDGDWLAILRDKIGKDVPIVGTLDPHANVSQQMIDLTQGLFPYRTNPHMDQRETGRRAANFLLSILNKNTSPLHQLWQAPFAIGIEKQHTSSDPCESFYRFAKNLCKDTENCFVEIILGFPYADVYEMGTAAIIISNDANKIDFVRTELEIYTMKHLKEFGGTPEDVDETFKKIDKLNKPVLLLDMGDNVGGGTFGNSTFLLEKLEATPYSCLICIFDPEAVRLCLNYLVAEKFEISFGRHPQTGNSYFSHVTLISTHDGKFTEQKPRHGGQVNYDMGSAAVIRTAVGNTVLLHSKRMPPFSLAQITSCNIDPTEFDVVIAKGVNAPIAAYAEVCPSMLHVYTPGPSQAEMTKFDYKNRRRPLYPFEDPRLC